MRTIKQLMSYPLISLLLLTLLPITTAHADLLQVPYYIQATNGWCWAASAAMVAKYYGETSAKDAKPAIIAASHNASPATGDFIWAPMTLSTLAELVPNRSLSMKTDLFENGFFSRVSAQAYITASIDAGNPLIICWWEDLGSKHAFVLTGYDGIAMETGHVYIHDPNGVFTEASSDANINSPMTWSDFFSRVEGWWSTGWNATVINADGPAAPLETSLSFDLIPWTTRTNYQINDVKIEWDGKDHDGYYWRAESANPAGAIRSVATGHEPLGACLWFNDQLEVRPLVWNFSSESRLGRIDCYIIKNSSILMQASTNFLIAAGTSSAPALKFNLWEMTTCVEGEHTLLLELSDTTGSTPVPVDTVVAKMYIEEAGDPLIVGTVLDNNGLPVKSVTITAACTTNGVSFTSIMPTSSDGSYVLCLPRGCDATITAQKDGYTFNQQYLLTDCTRSTTKNFVGQETEQTVSVIAPGYAVSETSVGTFEQVIVRLSAPFSEAVTVDLEVAPANNAVNGTLTLSAYTVTIPAGQLESSVSIDNSSIDGTMWSYSTGFTITPTIRSTAAAQAYYSVFVRGYVRIRNEDPYFTSTTLSTDAVVYTAKSFDWSVSDATLDRSTLQVTWNWGDNNTDTGTGACGSVTHTYTSAGTYNVCIEVRDKDGGYADRIITVLVRAPSTVNVGFDSEGGTACSEQTYTVGQTYGTLPTPTRSGYTFGGWWTGEGGTGEWVTPSSVVPFSTTNYELYAKWIPIPSVLINGDFEEEPHVGWQTFSDGNSCTFERRTSECGTGQELFMSRQYIDDNAWVSQTCDATAWSRVRFKARLAGQYSQVYGWGRAYIQFSFKSSSGTTLANMYIVSQTGPSFGNSTNVITYGTDDLCNSYSFVFADILTNSLPEVDISQIQKITIKVAVEGYSLRGNATAAVDDFQVIPLNPVNPFAYSSDGMSVAITGYSGPDGVVSLPYIIDGLPVTEIAAYAFDQCAGITSVTIPDSVTSIGDRAFSHCVSLTSINIPDSVTSIGSEAFYNCYTLTSVTIPDGVTSIGDAAFAECGALLSVEIGNTVTNIGDSAFCLCTSLETVFLPTNLASISGSTFAGCWNLTSIIIPASVTTIGWYAFFECVSLTSVSLPERLMSIDSGAFSSCTSLTSVTIPNSVTSIGGWAFSDCTFLASVFFTGDRPSIDQYAFDYTPATIYYLPDTTGWSSTVAGRPAELLPLSYESDGQQITITGLDPSYSGHLPIPDALNGLPVTSVADFSILECDGITSVNIPASVTYIGDGVFMACAALTNITVAASNPLYASANGALVYKPSAVLLRCPSGLNGLFTIPYGIYSIGEYAFAECGGITSFIIPESVAAIGMEAFYGCFNATNFTVDAANQVFSSLDGVLFNKNLTALIQCPGGVSGHYTIPDSVTSIGLGAFFDCTSLTSVTIPDSLTSIGDAAFSECFNLESIIFKGDAPSLGFYVFASTTATVYYLPGSGGWGETFGGLPAVLLPFEFVSDGLAITITRYIGTNNTVSIPASIMGLPVTSIGSFAFYDCVGLTSVNIADGIALIEDAAFAYCSSLTSVAIPGSVTSIGDYAFNGCSSLTSVNIPNGVASIADNAFGDCTSLTSLTIPESVTSIGAYAFNYCTGLNSITIPDSVTSIGDGAFYGCFGLTSVTLPGSVTSVKEYAFAFCSGLTSITIPNSATSIGDGAFAGCTGLTSVIIPASVSSIGANVFTYCSHLASVLFQGNAPSFTGESGFDDTAITVYTLPNTTGWGPTYGGRPTLLWNPTVRHDAAFGFSSEHFGFNIAGTPNIPFVIEFSTNLTADVWTPVETNTLNTSGLFYFSDPGASRPQRFYRIVFPQ